MKTAIDYLVETLAENGIIHSSDISKAKEMEKQQIIEHSVELAKIIISNPIETSGKMALELVDDYFKTTFKTDKG